MKINEIQEGKTYTNGKSGRYYTERKVLKIIPNKYYADEVQYQHIKGYKHPLYNEIANISLYGFAKWALNEIK